MRAFFRHFSIPLFACVLAFPCIALSGAALAVETSRVSDVTVHGNQRIEQSTIQSYLGIQPGANVGQYELDNALRRLFETGFFSDVQIVPKAGANGTSLDVRIVENPVINQISFEGNKNIEDKDIQAELELKPRVIYTRTRAQNDTRRILDLYRKQGRYSATVDPKLIKRDQNRVDLVFEINEGPTAKVERIGFVGNKMFSADDLRRAIRTAERRWYKFLSSDDTYDTDKLQYDQELLRRYYVSQGYADFQVKSAVAELSPQKDAFNITFTIEEGEKYDFGAVEVQSALKGISGDQFTDKLTVREGELYNASEVENSVDAIVRDLGDRGYAFIDVSPDFKRDAANKKVGVVFNIKEGPKVYVERIDIKGNSRTLDKVIRREFRLAEGDPYSTSKLARTQERLNNLGYFEKVNIANKPGSAPDKAVLDVDVTEKSTGELSLGGGYSSVDGALADFGIRETNLLGRGQDLRLRAMLAVRRQEYDVGFTEPYFLNREISAGVDLFKTSQDFSQQSSFDRKSNGGRLRMGYALTEHTRHSFNYTLDDTSIDNVSATASRFIREQAGSTLTSSVGQSISYDTRNNRFDPSSGMLLSLRQDVAGVGGDSHFLRHEADAAFYYPFAKQWTGSLSGSAGYIQGLGEDVRIQNRFFIGERQFRGFNQAGIGPRDTTTRDALGGNSYYIGTAELLFPLGLPEDLGFRGAIFTDVGSLWNAADKGPDVADSSAMRVSSGVGLAWTSPFGPIRIDLAKAIAKQKEDETQLIRFSFGTRF